MLEGHTRTVSRTSRALSASVSLGVVDRDLLLARAELGHILLHMEALLFEDNNDVVHDASRSIEPTLL